jgi:hypothetical protein
VWKKKGVKAMDWPNIFDVWRDIEELREFFYL